MRCVRSFRSMSETPSPGPRAGWSGGCTRSPAPGATPARAANSPEDPAPSPAACCRHTRHQATHRFQRVVGDHLAAIDDDDTVTKALRLFHVVGGVDQRFPLALES